MISDPAHQRIWIPESIVRPCCCMVLSFPQAIKIVLLGTTACHTLRKVGMLYKSVSSLAALESEPYLNPLPNFLHVQIMVNTKHNDYISGFCHHARERCLLAVSGDGTLSVHDLRQR